MRRLERSRTIPRIDDLPVWSIVCFDVRPGYRRRGIATALLSGAIDYARAHGAIGVEAYPTDPGDTATRRDLLVHGLHEHVRGGPASGAWSRPPATPTGYHAG
jgi:GNAT superfamily N-acetyltransferase